MDIEALSCCSCKEIKPLAAFTKRPDRPRGYAYHCKACQTLRTKKSINKHRQGYLARRRARYEEKADILKKEALERYRQNRDANINRHSEWKKENRPKVRALNNARKRRARLSTPTWANPNKIKQLYSLAAYWNEIWPGDPVHVDHIIPLKGKTVSGLHVETNLQLIRASDNMRKHNKLVDTSIGYEI